ncbi:MAG TPA: PAS domain-containing protein [Pirellulales bacterium]|jgi:PAS domain S-box-containing protein|nr:PAS domain-containing protein [Pirellulales bacterium]
MKVFKSTTRAFTTALTATVMVALVRSFVLIPLFGFENRVTPFFVAVLAAVALGGISAGVFATVLGVIASLVLTTADRGWDNALPENLPNRLGAFVLISGLVVWVVNTLLVDRRRIAASEGRMRAVMDNTSAVIYLKDLEGRYLLVNKRFEELFGITQLQVFGKTDVEVFPSEVVAILQANDRQVSLTGLPLEFEEVVPQSDGLHTYISVKFPIFDSAGRCSGVGGISTDITERKKTADALEAEQETLCNTIERQDQERQLIAYEIHDGLVQYATGALLGLEAVRGQIQSAPVHTQLDTIIGSLRKAVDDGRRIINGMHTTVLDHCGVVAAVDQLIEDEKPSHVQVEFIKDSDRLGRMASSIELALYHITREALTNSYRHSRSDKVRIELRRGEDRVHLEIRDWGIGLAQPAVVKGIHGLRGMAERARIAGGRCTVQNALDQGTQVVVDLPYLSRT